MMAPTHPPTIRETALINSMALFPSEHRHFHTQGRSQEIRVDPRVSINTNDAVIEMALQGQGLARLLSYQVAPHVAAGSLRTVLTSFEPPPSPIHLVHQEGQMVSAKVRAFVDFAAKRLKQDAHLE